MSLLKTLKKRYDTVSTHFGNFFIGPRKDTPIPANSIIACLQCAEFFAFTAEEIPPEAFTRDLGRLFRKEYRNRFGTISGRRLFTTPRYYESCLLCPYCLKDPLYQDQLLYLPVGPMCLLMALNHGSRNGKAR